MKKISISTSCYNEENNISLLIEGIINEMEKFPYYDYEIIAADNGSTDKTQEILRKIAKENKKIKVIVNNRNFGPYRSGTNAYNSATGDACIVIASDLQDPPELISEFLKSWEAGSLVVLAQKVKSKENFIKYFARKIYYKIVATFSDFPQYEQVTGFGLFDRKVVEQFKAIGGVVNMRHMVAELGYNVKLIPFVQPERHSGKSSYNIAKYFDFAISSLVDTSTLPLRLATIIGCITSFISFMLGVGYLTCKLIYWDSFVAGMAPIMISIFFLGSVQILFIGLLGEYIANIIKKLSKVPLVVEKELINFDEPKK